MEDLLMLAALAVIAFIQNMAFTASSRSRNSGDPMYHFWIAGVSNLVWFLCNILIFKQLWGVVTTGRFLWLAVVCVVYVACTSAGSAVMMKIMLKKEQGKRQVGAKNS